MLAAAVKRAAKRKAREPFRAKPRHVAGPELLQGLRAYTLDQYGPMSMLVLGNLGRERVCADFGEIVFNLIDGAIFSSKTESETGGRTSPRFSLFGGRLCVKPFLPPARACGPAVGAAASARSESA